MNLLYLFQIGPVQSFIAAARRTQDLAVGSKMLSQLAGAGVKVAQSAAGFEPVFPMVKDNGELPASIPHVFAFISSAPDPHALAADINEAIEERWREYAEAVEDSLFNKLGEGDWLEVYHRQAYAHVWREFYWVAVPYTEEDHQACYAHARHALSARKQLRHFPQVNEPSWKCSMTGAQSALPLSWDKLRRGINDPEGHFIRENERLGSLALIKRLLPIVGDGGMDIKKIYSTDTIAADNPKVKDNTPNGRTGKDLKGYLAVLHMDGDKMGELLSSIKTLDDQQAVSSVLSEFAGDTVPELIEKYGGKTGTLIYAGGDDVLALLPLHAVLACADAIRKAFAEAMLPFKYMNKEGKLVSPTMSAGIAITPFNLPLDAALELARAAEKRAKDGYGRDAVAITEAHGNQQHHAGAKWEDVMGLMIDAQILFSERQLSAKIAYDLQSIAHDMGGGAKKNPALKPARGAELKRLLHRRVLENAKDSAYIKNEFATSITNFAEKDEHSWTDAMNWLILARFLATNGNLDGQGE